MAEADTEDGRRVVVYTLAYQLCSHTETRAAGASGRPHMVGHHQLPVGLGEC